MAALEAALGSASPPGAARSEQDQPSDIPGPARLGERLEQRRRTLGARGSASIISQAAEGDIREDLSKVRMRKSLAGTDGGHPQVLRELADGLVRPLQKGDVPERWKKANTTWAEEQCTGWQSG